MPALFATTLFLSAALLFWVQPMVARMLLPLLGGTPAVWNVCMVFFQVMLLGGYAYAHWISHRLSPGRQVLLHAGVLLGTVLTLPIALSARALASVPTDSNPSLWLMGVLLGCVGLPFFAVSTNGPLLQKWFSESGHASAADPYYLYAASNLGSLVALLGYPLWLERKLRLTDQSRWWAVSFGALIVLIVFCGVAMTRGRSAPRESSVPSTGPGEAGRFSGDLSSLGWRRRLWWIFLAFVPSSLMLGTTTYLTTDVASIPLLWVLPLSLYLLTFVLAFAQRQILPERWMGRVLPIGAVGLAYLLVSEATQPTWLLVLIHLAVFFVAAMVCHGRLAAERPPPAHLTEYYLWLSVGGVLGGLFNALLAPLIFRRVAEYPLSLVLACLARRAQRAERRGDVEREPARGRRADWWAPLGVALLTLALAQSVPRWASLPVQLELVAVFALPLVACYATVDHPRRFALSLGALLWASSAYAGTHGVPLFTERNFFGVVRVTRDPLGPFNRLVHGNTIHGRESVEEARCCEPLSYYHRSGPVGQLMDVFNGHPGSKKVAVVGLGIGSMASYIAPGQEWTFYEINPVIVRLARDTNYFRFLGQCAKAAPGIVLGDARLQLRKAPGEYYGLIVLDAFSSDAIPLHLVSREALALYLSKLAPEGLLAFHISNRCLDLEPILGDLARDAHLLCHAQDETEPSAEQRAEGKDQSHWVVMGRRREDLGRLIKDARWIPLKGRVEARVWTDDFSNLLSAFRWR